MNKLKSKIVILGLLVAMLSCLVLLSGCGEASLSEIYVGKDGLPKKVTYVEGQDLDLTGGVLTTVNDDGTTGSVPLTADTVSVTGFDNAKLGKQTLTVTYNGKTTTFDVTVVARFTAENFEPNYFVGDVFDKTKGRVKIYRDNGTSFYLNINDDAVTVTAFDSTKAGKSTVTLKCNASDGSEYTGSFEVTVHDIAELEFKAPTKKVYNSHEAFDFKGGYFTVKAGGGSNFSKYVNITENMMTGFSPSTVTEANLTTPVHQTVIFIYAGQQFEFPVEIYYSGVYYIENAIKEMTNAKFDWTQEDLEVPASLGEKALEALKQYYALSVFDQGLIDEEAFENVVRPAAVYLHGLYLKEFERFSEVFFLSNSGFSIIARSYAGVEAACQCLKNPDDAFNVYAELLRDVYDDFGEVSYTETKKLSNMIFVHTEEYNDSLITSFTYMLELYDMLKVIPDEWNNQTLSDNAETIMNTVTKIANSGYAGHGNIQLYKLVSNWRTKDDLVEIIYSYYMYVMENGTEEVKTDLWKTVPMPGPMGDWYMALARAATDASNMKTYKDSKAYLYDVSMFMYYHMQAVKLTQEIKADPESLYYDIYTLLNGDLSLDKDATGAEYGYFYHMSGAMDSENVQILWNEYLEILDVFLNNSAVSVKEYSKDFQEIFYALSMLSPAELYDFLSSLHFQYNTAHGTSMVLDCREGVKSYFTYVLAIYYSTVTPESTFDIFEKLLLAMENYALIGQKETALEDFKALMAEIKQDYDALSDADEKIFDDWYGVCYEKYLLIYELETGSKTAELGAYAPQFNELRSLIDVFNEVLVKISDAETTDDRKNELVPVLFAIYEKADALRREILASGNQELVETFNTLLYLFGETESTLDRKVCEMRKIFVAYLTYSNRTINEKNYRAWNVYAASKIDEFLVDSVYLIIQGYKQAAVENVGNVPQLMNTLRTMDAYDRYVFMLLGFGNTYYAGAEVYYNSVYNNAEAVKAMMEAEAACLVYMGEGTEESATEFTAKFEAIKALYEALADKAAFNQCFEDSYKLCLAQYEEMKAESAA